MITILKEYSFELFGINKQLTFTFDNGVWTSSVEVTQDMIDFLNHVAEETNQ